MTEQVTPAGNLTNSGIITFTDVDLTDVHLVSANGTPIGTTLGTLTAVKDTDTTGTGTGGQLTWTYTVADSAVEYLAKDQTKVESFTITLDDQNGSVITKQIDVTITGTNDAPVVQLTPTFTTIDYPATNYTSAIGINDAGQIVGDAAGLGIGWEFSGGSFTSISDAGATTATAINNAETVVGYYSPVSSTPRYGFVIENGGTFEQINLLPGISTTANGINDAGVVVGASYLHGGTTYSAYVDDHGVVTYLTAPGAEGGSGYTVANDINNAGAIVGTFTTSYGSGWQGYLYQGGVFTTIADPDGANGTFVQGINDLGQIVGWYLDAGGVTHGFIYSGGDFTNLDEPAGVNGTQLNGINNAGEVVGSYVDGSNVTHGFVTVLNTLAGSVVEQVTPAGNLTTLGTLHFIDVDLTDVHLVSANGTPIGTTLGTLTAVKDSDTTGTGTGGQLTWTYTVADSAVEYLAVGESKVESFTITLNDQNGSTITKQIDVTITGTNDLPSFTTLDGDSSGGGFNETNGTLTATGQSSLFDVDTNDIVTVSVANDAFDHGVRVFKTATPAPGGSSLDGTNFQDVGSGLQDIDLAAYGLTKAALYDMFSIHPTGVPGGTDYVHDGQQGTLTWNFDSAGQAFDFLAAGETLTLYYNRLHITDGHSDSLNYDGAIIIRIDGTNDAPVIVNTPPAITEVPIPNSLPAGADAAAVQEIAPSISSDGRWVAFFSTEADITTGQNVDDSPGDVYLYDRATGATTVLTDAAHIPLVSRPDGCDLH